MSVKVNNANIFASLQDDSDNEAPVVKKGTFLISLSSFLFLSLFVLVLSTSCWGHPWLASHSLRWDKNIELNFFLFFRVFCLAPAAAKVAETKPVASTATTTVQKEGRGAGRGERKPAVEGETRAPRKEQHNRNKDSRDGQKPKGVPADHQGKDRHSGTGVPAYE